MLFSSRTWKAACSSPQVTFMRNKPVQFSGQPTQPFACLDLLDCMTQILKVISTHHTYWCDFWKLILVGNDVQILMMMEAKLFLRQNKVV